MRRTYAQIAQRINQGGYDLAFVMQCKVSNSPYVLRCLEVPSVYYCMEPSIRLLEPQNQIRGRFASFKRRIVQWRISTDRENARSATIICANSHYSVENIYCAYGVYPRYSPLGVDTELFRPLDLERGPLILNVGSLTVAKAQDFLVQSVGTLQDPPSVHFVFNFEHVVSQTAIQNWLVGWVSLCRLRINVR